MPHKKNVFDAVVIGVGSMGAATCYYLAKQGLRVLGIEQFGIAHENGSHGGQSRLIRQAYFEHPDYVPLLRRSYDLWKNLEEEAATKLFYPTGILYSGMANDFLISGSQKSAETYGIPLEKLTSQQAHHRYPQFKLPEEYQSIFEYNAGFLTPELAIRTFAAQATAHGASIHTQEQLLKWEENDNSLTITTTKGTYHTQKLILTAGAWSGLIAPKLQPKLKVTRQLVAWVNTKNDAKYALNKMPCWGINKKDMPGLFYGFPLLPNAEFSGPAGMKLGYHLPGEIIEPDDSLEINPSKADMAILTDFLKEFMPGCYDSINEIKHCKYTYTPDEHFVVDFLPNHSNVMIAAGFSGHGFKFAPVIGEILADLATQGKSSLPIEFLSMNKGRGY
jgi:sarcosine oxidase